MIPSLVASVTIEKTWKGDTKRTHRLHGDAARLCYANDGVRYQDGLARTADTASRPGLGFARHARQA